MFEVYEQCLIYTGTTIMCLLSYWEQMENLRGKKDHVNLFNEFALYFSCRNCKCHIAVDGLGDGHFRPGLLQLTNILMRKQNSWVSPWALLLYRKDCTRCTVPEAAQNKNFCYWRWKKNFSFCWYQFSMHSVACFAILKLGNPENYRL